MPLPDVPNVRHRMVRVNGTNLHIAESGDDDAPAVLLLHGFPQHWYMWRDLFGPLARQRHVIAVDFRGFGWSGSPRRGYSTSTRVGDVLAVMDELGLVRADLVGHDWGALVAFQVARDHADRVGHLVAISMVHPWPMQRHLAPSVWRWWVTALFEWPGIGPWILRSRTRVVGWLLARDAAAPSVWTDELRNVYTSVAAEPARAKAGQRLHMQLILGMPRLLLGRERQLDVPTLIIGGEQDALIPPAVLTVPERHKDVVAVHTIPGGHFLVDENPRQVTEAILRHLSGSTAAASGPARSIG